ncbi:MAG: hypothetical protein KAS72_04965 [Phycisphaerales bacterium]|nr:hypothetical protein [Phycisphaerales bacterium]
MNPSDLRDPLDFRTKRAISAVDPTLSHTVSAHGFQYPLGCIPTEPCEPVEGYTMEFETAQGEWPDCYLIDIVVSSERTEPLMVDLFALLAPDVLPILDVRGDDAYREMDPYLAAEPISQADLLNTMRPFRAFLFEDGHCGFGVMSEEPFAFVYLDDHKIITIRVELTRADAVEQILAEHGVSDHAEPVGVDSVAHEHRDVLWIDDNRSDLLDFYGVLDALRYEWNLELNIDPDSNVDDDGRLLGMTAWRVLLYLERQPEENTSGAQTRDPDGAYAELLLTARNLNEVDGLVAAACEMIKGYAVVDQVSSDRLRPEELIDAVGHDVDFDTAKAYRMEIMP